MVRFSHSCRYCRGNRHRQSTERLHAAEGSCQLVVVGVGAARFCADWHSGECVHRPRAGGRSGTQVSLERRWPNVVRLAQSMDSTSAVAGCLGHHFLLVARRSDEPQHRSIRFRPWGKLAGRSCPVAGVSRRRDWRRQYPRRSLVARQDRTRPLACRCIRHCRIANWFVPHPRAVDRRLRIHNRLLFCLLFSARHGDKRGAIQCSVGSIHTASQST